MESKKETALSNPVSQQISEVGQFITQAIEKGLPVETMERLFSLREKVKAEQAREAFVRALSMFQKDCPVIEKTKKVLNKDGRTIRYQYAPLDVIVEKIKEPLAQYGLSYNWDVTNEPGFITAIAKVTHEFGHSEVSRFQVPVDTEGYMTAPQKYASALTFAKRYSLCNVLGISTGDEDTDATDVNKEPDVKSVKAKIIFRLKALNCKTESKDMIAVEVKRLTKLELAEKNYDEIATRLQVLIDERNQQA